jgi:hypothetical protein
MRIETEKTAARRPRQGCPTGVRRLATMPANAASLAKRRSTGCGSVWVVLGLRHWKWWAMPIDPRALEQIYSAKERQRKRLADLPFHEKIRILISLQRRADSIIRSRGGPGRVVWKLPSQF